MWVRFTARFRWSPEGAPWSKVWQPCEDNVPTDCARQAIAAGKAVKIPAPRRDARRGKDR